MTCDATNSPAEITHGHRYFQLQSGLSHRPDAVMHSLAA
ncbi:hypothetical protein Agau_C200065 [Agrobacterium tumefaciens F2]|nr:hypothetical protein Agau_C200065 [Agrobacterium tumefaciens F2]